MKSSMRVLTKEQHLKETLCRAKRRFYGHNREFAKKLDQIEDIEFDYGKILKVLGKEFKHLGQLHCSFCHRKGHDKVVIHTVESYEVDICEKCLQKSLQLLNKK